MENDACCLTLCIAWGLQEREKHKWMSPVLRSRKSNQSCTQEKLTSLSEYVACLLIFPKKADCSWRERTVAMAMRQILWCQMSLVAFSPPWSKRTKDGRRREMCTECARIVPATIPDAKEGFWPRLIVAPELIDHRRGQNLAIFCENKKKNGEWGEAYITAQGAMTLCINRNSCVRDAAGRHVRSGCSIPAKPSPKQRNPNAEKKRYAYLPFVAFAVSKDLFELCRVVLEMNLTPNQSVTAHPRRVPSKVSDLQWLFIYF